MRDNDFKRAQRIFSGLGLLFFFIGIIGIIFSRSYIKKLEQNESVTAYLSDSVQGTDSEGDTVWHGIYSYTYNDVQHTYKSNVGVSPESLLDEEITVYVNEDGDALGSSDNKFVIFIFAIFSIVGFIFYIIGRKIKQNNKRMGLYQ